MMVSELEEQLETRAHRKVVYDGDQAMADSAVNKIVERPLGFELACEAQGTRLVLASRTCHMHPTIAVPCRRMARVTATGHEE